MTDIYPLFILGIGIVVIVSMITVLRLNAFISLITSAIIVSVLAPGDLAEKISRVALAFGSAAGKIGIVIALAVVIGKCMMDSGAADRIVRAFLRLLGEKRVSIALMSSGFVLSIPVFFDTVFYLLVPLARSTYKRTKTHYLRYVCAITTGGIVTHSLVPPTPGPLVMAENLEIDLGVMILIGGVVAVPAAICGLLYGVWCDKRMNLAMRPLSGSESEPELLDETQLPALWLSVLPIILPVALVSLNTIFGTLSDVARENLLHEGEILNWPRFCTKLNKVGTDEETEHVRRISELLAPDVRESITEADTIDPALQSRVKTEIWRLVSENDFFVDPVFEGTPLSEDAQKLIDRGIAELSQEDLERLNWLVLEAAFPEQLRQTPQQRVAVVTAVLGNVNLAMLVSTAIAMITLAKQRHLNRHQMSRMVEISLMSGGMIILITAAGGAFGEMLKTAEIGPAIERLAAARTGQSLSGLALLSVGFIISCILKIAQGSTTVAMITASAMMAAMVPSSGLGFHPVYLATAIGSGGMVGTWMNDSGFWIFAKMGGFTEGETLRSWTILLVTTGITGFLTTIILAMILPLA